ARLDDDGGTDRRDFLAQGAAAIAALALAACGLGVPTAPGSVSATTIKLSDYPSLANVGGVVVTQISGNPIAIVHETSTTFSAFSLICPHAGNTVQSEGTQGFYCPGHGARFSLAGQWTGGQPTGNLTSYPVRYDATAGSLTVGS
ncbi:MAG: ubiquinol-cytochrome c reductase iron-sulfur subunit, partial [Gemmatimonadaceae bacterium]